MSRLRTLLGVLVVLSVSSLSAQELPPDFPPMLTTLTGATSPGVFLLAPNTRILTTPYGYFVMVLDSTGKPLKWHRMPKPAFDCKVTKSGQMGYSVYAPQSTSISQSGAYILDSNMQIVDSVFMKNGYLTSQHGFDILPNGNKLVYGWEEIPVDMSKIVPNGNAAAIVVQGLLQEQDQDGNVVFQWRSLDNVPWEASNAVLTDAYIRSVHNNGLDIDTDGNYLLSMRTLSSILKVDRNDGNIHWYFGGKKNQFTYLNDAGTNGEWSFRSQHDPRRAFNGHLTLFDNGSDKPDQYSRGVEYNLDETAMTASVVWQQRQTPDVFANQQGSVQALRDGHHVVAWGTVSFDEKPAFTEVDADNNLVFSLKVPKEFAVYKAEKHAWPIGKPVAEHVCTNLLDNQWCVLTNEGDTVAYLSLANVSSSVNTISMRQHPFGARNVRFETKAPWIYPQRITVERTGLPGINDKLYIRAAALGIPSSSLADVQVWGRDVVGDGTFKKLNTGHAMADGVLIVIVTTQQEFIFGIPQPLYTPNQPVLAFPISGTAWNNEDTLTLRSYPQGRGDMNELEYGVVGSEEKLGGGSTRGERVKTTVLADGEYWWRARTMWDGEAGPWSDTVHFRVGPPYIENIEPNGAVTWPRDSVVTIRWNTNVAGPVKLVLMKGITEVQTIAQAANGATHAYVWRVPLTTPIDSGYSIQLQTVNKASVMAVGPSVIAITSGTTSVDDDREAKSMHLYPNPASDLMRLTSDNMLVHRISIYSQLGTLMSSIEGAPADDIVFDVSSLASGMYICEIQTALGAVHKPFVVNR